MVMALQSVFVPNDLAIKFVHQLIHRSVQISVGTFGKHVIALDMNIAFGSLPSFFFLLLLHGKQHFDIHNLVKMPNDSIKLACNVTTQGWGDLEVMTADRQVHK
jgi:hypothetical protein